MRNYVILSVFASLFLFSLFVVKSSSATAVCTPVDKYVIKSSDNSSEEVNFDFHNGNKDVDISADSGYTITEVWLDVNGDGISGYVNYGSSAGNYNPSGNDTITSAKVRVVKGCATPTATATATGASKVYVCKYVGTPGVDERLQTGQNPIEVSINTLPNGWSIGSYFADAHGRSYVLATVPQNPEPNVNNCPQTNNATPTATATSQPTATPTSTAVATATATSTSIATATPTDDPCEDRKCDQETATPTATPNGDVCPNLDGIQLSLPNEYHFDNDGINCLKFELGGAPQPPAVGGSNVLGASTSQVLGASTMAGTGVVEDSIFYSMFTLGSLLSSFGIMKNGKKNKKI